MDLRNEVGHDNMSFQMESKVEHDAQTCDDKAIRNDTPQAKPKVKAQPYKDSETEKLQRLLFIACTIAFASLLTAFATLVFSCGNHDGTERGFDMYPYAFRSPSLW